MKSWSSRLLVIAAVAGVAGCATWARWTHKAEPAAAPAPPPEARAAHVMLAPGEIKWRPFPPGGAGAKLVPGGEPVACLRLLDDLAAGERVRLRGEEEDQGGPAHQSLCPCRAHAHESPAGLASRNRRAARVGRKPRTVSMVSASSGLLSVRWRLTRAKRSATPPG